ncbi:MAG TPA: sulfotransferase [Rhizomicrobium sp.]|nr:sulfotransferase [Rhizomicrobium sp.]
MNTTPSPAAQALLRQAQSVLRAGEPAEAARILERCVQDWPDFTAARQHYATVLFQHLADPGAASIQIGRLIDGEPQNAAYRVFRAAILGQLGDYDAAITGYEEALALQPADARVWLRYGYVLRTAGRRDDAIAAFRKSLALKPSGEAWWSLADLRSIEFSATDLAAMQSLTGAAGLASDDRAQLHFALGKALEDAGDFDASFAQYERGNALMRSLQKYDADEMTAYVDRASAFFTGDFFATRSGSGCETPDPIFVVGLPRSGSTLIEQILASHSAIEGTMELSDIIAVARAATGSGPFDFKRYPQALAELDRSRLKALGETYLARTRAYRREGRRFFVDKMPNNFVHTGLIHLILPRARIIDVRRDPLACCLSAYKQHFAVGQSFSYGLADLGRYYADYVRLMAHFDSVLPGRVHRVNYEELVADPQREIRSLFAYCGLPFEEAALRFHENRRAVRTASSEQVRRPLSREGLDSWRHYDPWLGPLKDALGPTLTNT